MPSATPCAATRSATCPSPSVPSTRRALSPPPLYLPLLLRLDQSNCFISRARARRHTQTHGRTRIAALLLLYSSLTFSCRSLAPSLPPSLSIVIPLSPSSTHSLPHPISLLISLYYLLLLSLSLSACGRKARGISAWNRSGEYLPHPPAFSTSHSLFMIRLYLSVPTSAVPSQPRSSCRLL